MTDSESGAREDSSPDAQDSGMEEAPMTEETPRHKQCGAKNQVGLRCQKRPHHRSKHCKMLAPIVIGDIAIACWIEWTSRRGKMNLRRSP